ncbi:MAG: rhodanese-like domain-containing protein [Flavobacteriales bacterium]|jgi:phage shock protein E
MNKPLTIQILTALVFLMGVLPAGAQTQPPGDFADYQPVEFSKQMKEAGAIILDVRTPGEVSQGKIAGSVHLDWNQPSFRTLVSKIDRNAPVYVYCAAGGRSASAKKALMEMGFREVHDLLGGMDAWKKAGLQVVK